MELTTEQKGQVAELKATLRATELGFIVSKPVLPARYDLVIDDGANLIRAQVKYADGSSSNSEGVVVAQLRRWKRGKLDRRYDKQEVDCILVYVPKIDKVCIFSPDDWDGKASLYIRLDPPKNGAKKGIIMAQDNIW